MALLLVGPIYAWEWSPSMAAVASILATALLVSSAVSWAWRKLFKRRRQTED
jgi:hypothetical protein